MTAGGRRFVVLWAAGLLLLYGLGGYHGVKLLRGYAAETARIRQARIESLTESGDPSPTGGAAPASKPVDVHVGMTMNHIGGFALKESAWMADFTLSFRWIGDSVDPGASFRVSNGQIELREPGVSTRRGEERFEEYHVVARMTKPFDSARFPFGDEGLVVQIEDSAHRLESLRYVSDEADSRVGPDAMPRLLSLGRSLAGVTVRRLGTGQAATGDSAISAEAHSQFFLAMLVRPSGTGVYIKLFQALFASVAVTLIALFIKPTHVDCRFGLPVGGFFASVGNNIFVVTLLPPSDRLSLTDMINTASLITIFLVLVQSVISLHLYDTMNRERLSRTFDRVSFAVFLLGWLGVNLALPLAAGPQ